MPPSAESNLPHSAIHECEWLPEEGVEVFGEGPGNGGQWTFWLHNFKEAAEADVLEGRADSVGELLESRQSQIRHCPFCGVYCAASCLQSTEHD